MYLDLGTPNFAVLADCSVWRASYSGLVSYSGQCRKVFTLYTPHFSVSKVNCHANATGAPLVTIEWLLEFVDFEYWLHLEVSKGPLIGLCS